MLDPKDFVRPDDKAALRMENELLALENQHLRSLMGDPTSFSDMSDGGVYRAEYERLRKAESDLRWLLRRLEGTPVGPIFRRFPGWQTLHDRYLGGSS